MKTLLKSLMRQFFTVVVALIALQPATVSAQEEVEPFFRLNYYTDEFESAAANATNRFSSTNWVYDCTNAVLYWTNLVVYEGLWRDVYHHVSETNYASAAADPDSDEGFLSADWFRNLYFETYTNGNCETIEAHVEPTTNTFYANEIARVTSSGKKGTINGRKYNVKNDFLTKGMPGSTNTWVYRVSVTASDTNSSIPYTNITVFGKQLATNGYAYVALMDNTTNPATPSISGYTNVYWQVSATKFKISAAFANSGPVPQATSTNSGFNSTNYSDLVAVIGTNYGVATNPIANFLFNSSQVSAEVPDHPNLTNGWTWHQDANLVYYWQFPGQAIGSNVFTNFTGNPDPIPGPGNDNAGIGKQEIPDAWRMIYSADGPGVDLTSPSFTDAPDGAVVTSRHNLRTWLTWDGGIASYITVWHSFITVQKVYGEWIRIGPNVIEEGEDLSDFTPP